MATRINLLPWRDMRRKEMDQRLAFLGVILAVLMALIVFWAYIQVDHLIAAQQNRNNYLKGQIAILDSKIKKIRNISKKRAELMARMNVIYKLQADRTRMVHIMDALVRTLPQGLYYTSFSQRGDELDLQGAAQSNARIASLLRNLSNSDWFANPDLKVVHVVRKGGSLVSQFSLSVTQLEHSKKDVADNSDTDSKSARKKLRRRRR